MISKSQGNGITFIGGGKWTTWREMAEDVLDRVLEQNTDLGRKAQPCSTLWFPLIGAAPTEDVPDGWHLNLNIQLIQKYGVGGDIAQYLTKSYGTRSIDLLKLIDGDKAGLDRLHPEFPYTKVEVRYAVRSEYARTPTDILCRRTRLAFLNEEAAHTALSVVCDIMAEELGWSDEIKYAQMNSGRKVLDLDFVGRTPNKIGARLRAATLADIDEAFDAVGLHKIKFELTEQNVGLLADKLGFPFTTEEKIDAVRDIKNFLEKKAAPFADLNSFGEWWNSEQNNPGLSKLRDGRFAQEAFQAFAEKQYSVDRKLTVLKTFEAKAQGIQKLADLATGAEIPESEILSTVADLEQAVSVVSTGEAPGDGSTFTEGTPGTVKDGSVIVTESDFLKWATQSAHNSPSGLYRSASQRAMVETMADSSFGQDSKTHS